jgi:methylenetetrahydrofolate dehydrogenase (NADP+)/methenyltetrahydrofolate cyclohydrolase
LASILLDDSPDALNYVKNQEKASIKLGYHYKLLSMSNAPEEEIVTCLEDLNHDSTVHGIIIQRPIPKRLSFHTLAEKVSPEKDIDCIHPYTAGMLFQSKPVFYPPTPYSVMMILEHYQIAIEGMDIVIIGRSDVVGKPLSMMLLDKNATVQICHSHTSNLSEKCNQADIVIVAVGKPKFLTKDMVQQKAIVIDVGINVLNGTLTGDADFESLVSHVSAITPVPGGVGSLTTSILLQNTLQAYYCQMTNK